MDRATEPAARTDLRCPDEGDERRLFGGPAASSPHPGEKRLRARLPRGGFAGASRLTRAGRTRAAGFPRPGVPAGADPAHARAAGSAPARPRAALLPRVVKVLLVCLAAAGLGYLAWRYAPGIWAWVTDPEAVRGAVAQQPVLARLAIAGVNVVQIVVAVIPGEPVELASGYALGFWEGTASCLVASAIGSTLVFAAVRRWGRRVVGLFFSPDKLDQVAWLQNTARLELVMFVVFLIPGTPKDLLTYAAGLTRMRWRALLPIVTIGRIPSVITSTFAAAALGEGNWQLTVAALVLAAALALAGGAAYALVTRRARGE